MAKPLSIKRAVSTVGAFVVALGWYFYGGDALIAAEQATGTGWNDARSALVTKYTQFFDGEFKALEFKGNELGQMAECVADKAIQFLNDTDCRYKFNTHNTTREEHLSTQETCLKSVGFDSEEMKYGLECFKTYCPNDWSLMRGPLVSGLKARFLKQDSVQEEDAQRAAVCGAESMIQVYNDVKCPFILAEANSWQTLLNTADKCHEQKDVLEKVRKAMTKCKSN